MAGYTTTRPPRLRFHAVTVVAGSNSCMQSLELKDVRLLSADAPRLPMGSCDRPDDCACRFRHHEDRRVGPRRQAQPDQVTGSRLVPDRRAGRGRRATDIG
jgi:hypothetical protein